VGEGGCTKSGKSCYKEEFVFIYWRRFWLALYSEFLVSGFELGAFSLLATLVLMAPAAFAIPPEDTTRDGGLHL
jgi:hypothetical protein